MGQRRAWGWVAALRDGATTPWRDWSAEGEPSGSALPGAQQLELLRRLNVAAESRGRRLPRATADRVLAASVSGRGRSDLALEGADDPRRFGARPVDPATLGADELLRVAATLIAEDVARVPAPSPAPLTLAQKVRTAPRRISRAYHLLGDEWRAQAYREHLTAHGHPPGGRTPTPYVIAGDLATVVADAWTARAFDQGGPTWTEFLEAFVAADHLPPRADLVAMARSAAREYDAAPVTIVIDHAALAGRLGAAALGAPPALGAHAVDLVRRVGAPLGLLVAPETRPPLLRATLGRRLDGTGGPAPTVPPRWGEWLRRQAERARNDLAADGYPVLGDLEGLLPAPPRAAQEEPVLPVDAEVLALALGLLLDPVTDPVTDPATEKEDAP